MSQPDHPVEITQLALRVDELTAGLARLTADVEDLSTAVLPAEFAVQDDDPPAAEVGPVYARLEEWVEQYFQPTFRRPVGGEIRWCARWLEHAEAVTRLEALWRSWEALRLDPNLGIATWLTTYLDPILAVLLGRVGPFAQCTPDRHV
ncbi:MAG TPA: DUF4913 domain-containing protein [Kineosporiaceae bacterium]